MRKNYHELFRDIVAILRRDYAGQGELDGCFDPQYYTQSVGQAWHDDKLDDLLFLRYVSQMLACTGDRHLKLTLRGDGVELLQSPGFFTRRFADVLYVTHVTSESRLHVGDRITAVNGGTPSVHRAGIQKNFFFSELPEREDWNGLLKMADTIDVIHRDGSAEQLPLGRYPLAAPAVLPLLHPCGADALYFRPGLFDGSGAAAALAADNRQALLACNTLILDLRNGGGMADEDFFPLLPLVCKTKTSLSDLLDTDYFCNYTRLNCILKAAGLQGLAGSEPYIEELSAKAGKGFVEELDGESNEHIAPLAPAHVVVLTDTWCRDSGEAFVLAAKRAGAQLLGRPTLGTLDYGGDVHYELDDRFVLTWPTAVTKSAREGHGMKGVGVSPDTYISFSPEECETDLLLAAALERL